MASVDLSPQRVPARPRPLAWFAIGACGAVVAVRHGDLPVVGALVLVLVVVLALVPRLRAPPTWLVPGALGAVFGSLLAPLSGSRLPPMAPGMRTGEALCALRGTLEPDGQWDPSEASWRGVLATEAGRLHLSWIGAPAVPLGGDVVAGLARVGPPAPALCPEDLGAAARDLRRGFLGNAVARGTSLRRVGTVWSPRRPAEWLHQELAPLLIAHLGPRVGALVCRLALGTGPQLPAEVLADHAATGLSHLLAVSGVHVVLVAALVARLLRAFPGTPRAHARAAAAVLLFYAALTGLQPPVVRAVGAILCHQLAFHRGLRFDAPSAMAATAVASAALDPEDVGSLGFVLSYAAVAGLLWLSPPLVRRVPRAWPAPARVPLQACALSVGAAFATAPITLWVFRQAAPWSIPATPLLAPLVLILIAGGLALGGIALASATVAALLGVPLRLLGELYLASVALVARLPVAPLHALTPATSPLPWLVLGLAALWCLWRPGIARAAWGCGLVALAHFVPHAPPAPQLRLFAVGHGLACLLQTQGGQTLLIDCGSLDRHRPAERLVIPGLRRVGVTRFDHVVVTHSDSDHAGGILPVLAGFPVGHLWLASHAGLTPLAHAAAQRGILVTRVAPGAEHRLDPEVALAAPPIAPTAGNTNDAGLWLTGTLGGQRLLLLADQQEAGLAALFAARRDLRSAVLLAPHHGRPCARTIELLEHVRPQLVLVSDGWQFGVSAEELSYRGCGALCLRTAVCGEILLWPDARAGIVARAFRAQPLRPMTQLR